MATFANAQQVYDTIGMFLDQLTKDPEIGPKFVAADDGHAFWLGELNMALALAKGKVKVTGPISKIMKLLPAMRPAFPKYKAFLSERGGPGSGGAPGETA